MSDEVQKEIREEAKNNSYAQGLYICLQRGLFRHDTLPPDASSVVRANSDFLLLLILSVLAAFSAYS